MTYELAIGDRTHSSWSLRGWLLFRAFDIPVSVNQARMYTDAFPALLEKFAPAKLVPCAKLDDHVVWDSLAMAEELNDRHPEKNMWPTDPKARAFARSMAAEMHSGFAALREECSMNLEYVYTDFPVSDAVKKDLMRIEVLWAQAKAEFGQNGPWLFGNYSIVDVFFSPVATRYTTYGLPRGDIADAYIKTHLNHTVFRQWRAMGKAENYRQDVYHLDFQTAAWPVKPLDAQAIEDGTDCVNEKCPYSGKAPQFYLSLNGKTYGFCNAFCRDKTVADAEAWPEFMALVKD